MGTTCFLKYSCLIGCCAEAYKLFLSYLLQYTWSQLIIQLVFSFSLGLSLKTQELTALFLAVRLYCSFVMEGDIHTVLDFATLVSTAWVLYMIRFKLKSSYIAELDNLPLYYMVKARSFLFSHVDIKKKHVVSLCSHKPFICNAISML